MRCSVDFQLIRTRRKTIGLQITNDAKLIVRAPYFASEDYIHTLIQRKEPWIRAKQEYFKKRREKAQVWKFTPAEEAVYKAKALEYIAQRVEYFAQMTGLKYKSVRINNAATRLGSCGHKDTLNFTWRLILAPARVVDYVVVHELMHIKQKNHSRQFWAEVRNIITDYRQDELWLKENPLFLSKIPSDNAF